jgi:sterol desaturase/sphingolipid hydroxylase (fatty acid hydroxylase superfamily)
MASVFGMYGTGITGWGLVFHATYSFFTHTRLGKNLSFLEHIFITPSLHSVHHACNERYIRFSSHLTYKKMVL